MSANPSVLGALLYADEASFGEVSTTFDERLPIVNSTADMVAGLTQTSLNYTPTLQFQNDGLHDARMVQGGSFDIELMLTGHGSTGAGAITASVLGTFLGRVFGSQNVAQSGSTASSGDVDTITTAGGSFVDGGIIRVGAIADTRGNGQMYALSDGSGPLELLNAMNGSPSGGDVVYATEMVFPNEGPTAASVTSLRFNILTANQRYRCYGCYPTAVSFSGLNPGELPRVTVTMAVSAWESENASTFPTTTSTDFFSPAPAAAGSLFVNDVGTTTQVTYDARDVSVDVELVNVPLTGQEASREFQSIVGVRRMKCQASLTFTLDREAAGSDTWGTWWNTKLPAYQHAMFTVSAADSCAVGFYFPKLKRMADRPTQQDRQGLNAHTVRFTAITGDDDASSELERANMVLALG